VPANWHARRPSAKALSEPVTCEPLAGKPAKRQTPAYASAGGFSLPVFPLTAACLAAYPVAMTLGRRTLLLSVLALAACGGERRSRPAPQGPAEINRLIAGYAREYDVPADLIHSVVARESGYNPSARNGPYYGLMQILPQTARTMGFRGEPEELLDASTNLHFGVKYLRGAWLVSGRNREKAEMWYRKGYYYEAKRKGLLEQTGLRS
jgi:soluble lytic murein transglycosylase-like protein